VDDPLLKFSSLDSRLSALRHFRLELDLNARRPTMTLRVRCCLAMDGNAAPEPSQPGTARRWQHRSDSATILLARKQSFLLASMQTCACRSKGGSTRPLGITRVTGNRSHGFRGHLANAHPLSLSASHKGLGTCLVSFHFRSAEVPP
jgi:hypothetical protein